MEIKDMPIEILGLGDKITNHLKSFFVYTVGQLAAKTKSDLERIKVDQFTIGIIEAQLGGVSIKLSEEIEPEDQIERLELEKRTYNVLKRAGISRISDLQRFSRIELLSINNASEHAKKDIQAKLIAHLGDNFSSYYVEGIENKKELSIGYVVDTTDTFNRMIGKGIYTVRDLLKRTIKEKMKGTSSDTWEVIKSKLSELDESFVLGIGSEPENTALQALKELKASMTEEKQMMDGTIEKLERFSIGWRESPVQ